MNSILISGISGKIGSLVLKFAKDYNFRVVCGVDKKTFSDADCPVYKTFNEVKENVSVVIDFSSPTLTESAIDFCRLRNCALVSGTTGLNKEQQEKIKILSKNTPVCWANNFSKNLIPFLNSATILKNQLDNFDVAIIEEHNKNKKDSPSGTANYLAEKLNINQILSVRGGNLAGVHKIIFLGESEEIELIHTAYDKSIFAKGALHCATQILKKEKGFYQVSDLLTNKSQ